MSPNLRILLNLIHHETKKYQPKTPIPSICSSTGHLLSVEVVDLLDDQVAHMDFHLQNPQAIWLQEHVAMVRVQQFVGSATPLANAVVRSHHIYSPSLLRLRGLLDIFLGSI